MTTPFHADVFVGDGMFLEANIGHRQEKSVLVWGLGAELFYGTDAISKKKLATEGQCANELILLGYHVNLLGDTISLPGPKILGASNLINQPEFDPGFQTLGLRSVQELRGVSITRRIPDTYGDG